MFQPGMESDVTLTDEPRGDAIKCVAEHGDTIAMGWCRELSPTDAQLGSEIRAKRSKAQVSLSQVQNASGQNWVVSPQKEIDDTASGGWVLGHGSQYRVVGSTASQFLVMKGEPRRQGEGKKETQEIQI